MLQHLRHPVDFLCAGLLGLNCPQSISWDEMNCCFWGSAVDTDNKLKRFIYHIGHHSNIVVIKSVVRAVLQSINDLCSRTDSRAHAAYNSPSSGRGVGLRWVWHLIYVNALWMKSKEEQDLQVAWTYGRDCFFLYLWKVKSLRQEALSGRQRKVKVFKSNLRCVSVTSCYVFIALVSNNILFISP